jgi:hypothetical protein
MLPAMTGWIVLAVLTTLVVLALRYAHPAEPLPPEGYERERQLAELRAMQAGQRVCRLP